MTHEVWHASPMPYWDYWVVMREVLDGSGHLRWGALFELRNEHPFLVPTAVYLANARLTGGSNVALGLYSVAVTVGLLLTLWRWTRDEALDHGRRMAAIVAAAALLFSPHGVHNFVLGMSGVAWLTTNLLVVLALDLQARGRSVAALAPALAASATYGTGLPVWGALAVVAWQARQPYWRRWLAPAVGLAVGTFYALLYARPGGSPGTRADPYEIAATMVTLLGQLSSQDRDLAAAAGVAVAVAGTCLMVRGLRDGDAGGGRWSGLIAWSVVNAALMAVSRAGLGADVALSSRYASIAAMGVIAVGAAALRTRAAVADAGRDRAVVLAIGLVALVTGWPDVLALRATSREQDELAIAVRVGAADGYPRTPGPLAPVLAARAHYPFTDRFTADCGLLGRRAGAAAAAPGDGALEGRLPDYGPAAIRLGGWVRRPADIACLVIVDATDVVVGAGVLGHHRHDTATRLGVADYDLGWQAVAPATARQPLRAVVVARDGSRRQLAGTIDAR